MLVNGPVIQEDHSYRPTRLLHLLHPLPRSPRQSSLLGRVDISDGQSHRHSVAVPERPEGDLGALTPRGAERLEWHEGGVRVVMPQRTYANDHAEEHPMANASTRDEPNHPRIEVPQGTADDTSVRPKIGAEWPVFALAQEAAHV
ncbi:hypothetical protein V565_040200 [Rhizoctonia solani 123E]|uniref:Uncharacterized protein n=1 Tax=Rhizoctonia solani 123E TaxID=1423351 RepID=A0A074SS58_9AGAM|nr:hypothetical protein V565_040200 [Rhizoctonia solani 123E]